MEEPAVEVKTKAPLGPEVTLPGGFIDGNEVIKTVEVRELTGVDEEAIAKAPNTGKALNVLLQRGLVKIGSRDVRKEDFDALLSGDRDAILIGIRRITFGETLDLSINCLSCGESQEVAIDLVDDIPVASLEDSIADRTWTVDTKKGIAVISLPTGITQKKLLENSDKTTAEINTLLLSGCVMSVNGMPSMGASTVLNLGMADRSKIIDQILEKNPGPRLGEVKKTCKACGEDIALPLSLVDLFRVQRDPVRKFIRPVRSSNQNFYRLDIRGYKNSICQRTIELARTSHKRQKVGPMYDDTKAAMGVGPGLIGSSANSVTNLKNDFLSLANVIEYTVLPKIKSMADTLNATSKNVGNLLLADKSGRVVGSSAYRVAPAPPVAGGATPPGGFAGAGAGQGTGDGGRAGGAETSFRVAASGLMAMKGMQYLSTVLPGVPTSVMQDFLTQRSAFFGQGGFTGTLQQQTAQINSIQKMMARNGVALNSMDSTNALARAQAAGLSAASNFRDVMAGVATASAFTPGMGQEAIAAAVGGVMNAPTTVNLAKTIGINIRDASGNVMPPDKLADQIWNYLTRYNGGKPLTKKQVQISMMPGNGLYGMLSGLFSNDSSMMTIIGNMLVGKAQFGGAELGGLSKDQLVQAGVMSATTRNISNQVSAQTNLLTATAAATAGGYAGAADIGQGMNNLAAAMSNLTAVLGGANGLFTGITGLGGGAMGAGIRGALGTVATGALFKTGMTGAGKAGGLLSRLLGSTGAAPKGFIGPLLESGAASEGAGIFGMLARLAPFLFLASGGPADSKTPYIVGEEGPELFIPKTDGMVIPNHVVGLNRAGGGGVSSSGGTPQDVYKFLLSQGLSPSGATGLIGNLVAESNLRPGAVGDAGTSGGIAQWHLGRWSALKSFAKSKGLSATSLEAQQQYLVYEMKTKYPSLWQQLSSKDITEGTAADLVMRQYERPNTKDKYGKDISAQMSAARAAKGIAAIKGNWDPTINVSSGSSTPAPKGSTGFNMSAYQYNAEQVKNLSGILASSFGGQGAAMAAPSSSTYNSNYNYGGVSITIQADKNPQATADALKKALKDSTNVDKVGGK